jgi:ketosteroid isomerase-like protein
VGEINGQDAIQAVFNEGIFSGAIASLRWAPERAEVSVTGDLGYTVGRYQTSGVDSEGVRTVVEGTYVRIWRRQLDDSWKVEMTLGNPVGAPQVVPPPSGGGVPENRTP